MGTGAGAASVTMKVPKARSGSPGLQQIDTLVCKDCQCGWMWPRNLHFFSATQVPQDLHPGDAFVLQVSCHSAPIAQDVFRVLDFVRAPSRKLVRDFGYDPHSGQVFYDLCDASPGATFVSLVTLNSWWSHLFGAMLSLALGVQEFVLNCAFALALLSDGLYDDDCISIVYPAFLAIWLGSFAAALAAAMCAASRIWKSHADPDVGNVITQCNSWDACEAFFAVVAAVYFGLDQHVRDIVVHLHPWKLAQPYAAIKLQGSRAFVVNQGPAATELSAFQGSVLVIRIWMAVGTFVGKAVVAFRCGQLWDVVLTVLAALTVLALLARSGSVCGGNGRIAQPPNDGEAASGGRAADDAERKNQGGSPNRCTRCGQYPVPAATISALRIPEEFSKGTCVQLKLDPDLGERNLGPLDYDDCGTILEVAPVRAGRGRRVLVHADGPRKPGVQEAWWYNAVALEIAEEPPVHEKPSSAWKQKALEEQAAAVCTAHESDAFMEPDGEIPSPEGHGVFPVHETDDVGATTFGAHGLATTHPQQQRPMGLESYDSPRIVSADKDMRIESLRRQNAELREDIRRLRQNEDSIRSRVDELIGMAMEASSVVPEDNAAATKKIEALQLQYRASEFRAQRLAEQVAKLSESMGKLVSKMPPSSPEALHAGEALVRARLEADYGPQMATESLPNEGPQLRGESFGTEPSAKPKVPFSALSLQDGPPAPINPVAPPSLPLRSRSTELQGSTALGS